MPSFSRAFNARRLAWIAAPALLAITWFARHRIYIAYCLAYTYFAFTFLPTAVIGEGDGFDLLAVRPPPDAPEIVPRILHQVRLGNIEMREKWIAGRQSCLDAHQGRNWTFIMWEDENADAFVKENYPDLFDMYRGYGQEIQRSNVIRYLILNKMGGIYLDLDVKCKVPLDPFLTQPWLSPPGLPTGINNAFLTSTPGNPFLGFVIERLQAYDLNWISLYATDMFSAGCHFISTMHALYPQRDQLKVLPEGYKLGGISNNHIFEHFGAGSWHRADAAAIKIVGNVVEWILRIIRWTWRPILAIGVLVCGGVAAQSLCAAAFAAHERRRAAYGALPWDEEHALTPRSSSPPSPTRSSTAGEKVW
ncbi:glycosyltransferase family 32 protein [Schizophyllum commune]